MNVNPDIRWIYEAEQARIDAQQRMRDAWAREDAQRQKDIAHFDRVCRRDRLYGVLINVSYYGFMVLCIIALGYLTHVFTSC